MVGVYWDYKGNGGAIASLGEGALSNYLRKSKLKTQSLTETKMVTVNVFMPGGCYG